MYPTKSPTDKDYEAPWIGPRNRPDLSDSLSDWA